MEVWANEDSIRDTAPPPVAVHATDALVRLLGYLAGKALAAKGALIGGDHPGGEPGLADAISDWNGARTIYPAALKKDRETGAAPLVAFADALLPVRDEARRLGLEDRLVDCLCGVNARLEADRTAAGLREDKIEERGEAFGRIAEALDAWRGELESPFSDAT